MFRDLALPSHFTKSSFTIGAVDNFDHEEARLSGMQETHDTVMVLFQEAPDKVPCKAKLSSAMDHKLGNRSFDLLPCQQIRRYCKPTSPVTLPPDFKVSEVPNISSCDEITKEETLVSMLQATGGLTSQNTFTCSGTHAIISEANVLMQKVGFLTILPYPVTANDSVYSCMKNFLDLLLRLDQQSLPVACDEGVFHIAAEIQLAINEFTDLVLLLGSFHMTKILLACIGKYLTGSGLENVFIENHVFGVKVTESVLKGSNYVRSVKGMFMLAEVIERLKWKAFLSTNGDDADFTAIVGDIISVMKHSYAEDAQ